MECGGRKREGSRVLACGDGRAEEEVEAETGCICPANLLRERK